MSKLRRTVVLIVLDGWGIGKADESNPIHIVNPPRINQLKNSFPYGTLQASGISVGLPWGEEGNSEIGHLNIGAGKVLYQYYPRITLAIRDKKFFQNEILKAAAEHAQKNNSTLHFVGLIGEGNVHSSFEHITALIEFAKQEHIENYALQLFTDGRDSAPKAAASLIAKLPKDKIASIAGRYYAMDRTNYWDRTETAYRVLTGEGPMTNNIEAHIQETYARDFSDEFVAPARVAPEGRHIKDNDAVVFFNFREDRMRQITAPFIKNDFTNFKRTPLNNLYVATMTKYKDDYEVPVIFPPEYVEYPLGRILSEAGKTQLRIAETQKYPHITYFFNGLREAPYENEYRILIPSEVTLRPETQPQMMAKEITTRVAEAVGERTFDFILANYANPDVIAHTGNYEASIRAVRVIDEQMGQIIDASLANDAILIITSDHGNVERLFDPKTGTPETKHDASPVPIYLVAKDFERQRSTIEIHDAERASIGILADIAPTILDLMGIQKPSDMTGTSLLRLLV